MRSNTSKRLSEQDARKLRAQLKNLGCEHDNAETPSQFARRLYPVREHLHALDHGVVLIVGPRGAGQSTLFKALFSENRSALNAAAAHVRGIPCSELPSDSSEWTAAHPDGAAAGFPDTRALSRCVHSDEDAMRIWHAMLLRRLADRLDPGQRERWHSILAPPAADIGGILKAYEAADTSPTRALDELEHKLKKEGRHIFVGYEALDTPWSDSDLTARMVHGLVAFWSDYSRRWRRIRAKVFLSSDLFRRGSVAGTADFAKLSGNRTELSWSDSALLGMLVKRIANTSEDLAAYCRNAGIRFDRHETLGLIPAVREAGDALPLLERLTGKFTDAGRKTGLVRNWTLNHLQDGNGDISPRSLIRFLEQAARKDAANQSVRPPQLIHPAALRQALDDVSADCVTHGISSGWPWLESVKTKLAGNALMPWTRNEVVDLIGAAWDDGRGSRSGNDIRPPVNRPEDFVDYIVELGIFRRLSDDRIDVAHLYRSGLNLRRKGRVRRDTRSQ